MELQEFRELLKKFNEFGWMEKLTSMYEISLIKNEYFLSGAKVEVKNILKAIKIVDRMRDSQIRYYPDWKSVLMKTNDILNYLDASETSFMALSALMSGLKSALKQFTSFKVFKNDVSIDMEDSKIALEEFIKVGELIRSNDDEYKNSRIYNMESLLINRDETLRSLIKPQNMPENTRTEYSFIALAAPSMEGKTQSAFTFNRLRPLYFPVSGARAKAQTRRGRPQKIYQNFSNLTKCLIKCAKADFRPSKPRKYLHSASSILQQHRNKGFWTLGFLKKLAEESSKMSENQPWMHFHATRPNFTFQAASIAEIEEESTFKGYVLFLDEFVADPLFVFVQYLIRAAKIPCIIVDTNAKKTNFVETRNSSGSSLDVNTWSIVITKLDPASKAVLNEIFQLENSIKTIKQGRLPNDSVCLFLDHFIDIQLQHLRPGVASYVSGILKAFAENMLIPNMKLGPLLDHVCENLKRNLLDRQPSLSSNDLANLGRIALLLPESYKENHQPYKFLKLRDTRFSKRHLFYLENPSDADNWIFLTFPATSSDWDDELLGICRYGRLDDWDNALTEFYADEFFTIASCLFIRSESSISYLLQLADKNIKLRRYRSNVVEVSAALCVVDASQYSRNTENVTFSSFDGQDGISFLKNIIYNIITEKSLRSLTVSMPEELSAILALAHVPYLYSVDFSNPVYEKFASFEDGFSVQKYEKTSDNDQSDGKFSYRYSQEMRTLTCECKYRNDKIGSGLLLEMLEKSIGIHDAKISFVFCRTCVKYPNPSSKFTKYCAANQINVYRVRNDGNWVFKVVPFSAIVTKPSHICIIYETFGINLIK